MRARSTFVAVLTALALCSGSARADPPGGPGGMMPDPPPGGGPRFMMRHGDGGHGMMGEGGGFLLPLVLHRANLSPEQRDKVRKILQSDRESLQKLFSDLRKANDDLSKKLLAPGDLTLSGLKPELDAVSSLRRQLMEQGIKTALEVRKVLTAEQLAKVAEVKQRMDKLHAEMRDLMEEGDEPPPPPPP
jgi:Spy/CpxP family protein refolding chaperone